MAYDKRGIAPADPTTPVGQFRFGAGDSEFRPTDPPEEGFGLYQLWSDADIIGILAIAGGSVPRAISIAYGQIGASYASQGATIKTDDLSVSVKDAVGNWLALSNYWKQIADDAAERESWDIFDLVPVREDPGCWRKPEAAPWPLAHYGLGPGEFWW